MLLSSCMFCERTTDRSAMDTRPEGKPSSLPKFCQEKQRRKCPQPKGPGISAPSVRGAAVSRPQLASGDRVTVQAPHASIVLQVLRAKYRQKRNGHTARGQAVKIHEDALVLTDLRW